MQLEIAIGGEEMWDEKRQEFIYPPKTVVRLKHSLVSIAKWESKYHKCFLKKKEKSIEEWIYYVRCMTITQNVDDKTIDLLVAFHIDEIIEYIENPMSAVYIPSQKNAYRGVNSDSPTNEYWYYLMFSLGIPKECETWHLNRLIALIHIFEIKNKNNKKSRSDIAKEYAQINEARKKKLNTTG